jgi:hypothetical protein
MRRSAGLAVLAAAVTALVFAGGTFGAGKHYDPDIRGIALTGTVERPAGDPDGSGTARIFFDVSEGLVCWALVVRGVSPIAAAHIHSGVAGETGPIVVPLGAPTRGASKGCTAASRALIRQIIANPAGYYVNTHNADYPAGALRGQLR